MPRKIRTVNGKMAQYTLSLNNTVKMPELASEMSKFGYPQPKIDEGFQLLNATANSIDTQKKEQDEEKAASAVYQTQKEEVNDTYATDRKKAKIAFMDDMVTLNKLALLGEEADIYDEWVADMKILYKTVLDEPELQAELASLQFTRGHAESMLSRIDSMERSGEGYYVEKGESEQARLDKVEQFNKLEHWMSRFYKVARIALADKPQLLEAIGLVIKS